MKTKIIAFAGRKQSGKTTCSEFIVEGFNNMRGSSDSAKIYNFADPLKKDVCMNVLGLTYDQCYGNDDSKNELTNNYWDEKQLTAREVMQIVGTDMFRKMQHNVWVDATLLKIKNETPELAIIADCRFPNEIKAIKDAGGLVIKLNRNPHNSNHASETALDSINYDQRNFDIVILNQYLTVDEQNYYIFKFLKQKGILSL
jgi:hypothetical protein